MDLAECRTLARHAEWADSLIWKSVLALPAEDTELRERLHHIHLVQWAYLQIWRRVPVNPREISSFSTLGELRAWASEFHRDLASYLATMRNGAVTREVHFPWADRLVARFGSTGTATWSETLLQVTMHSSYHRGQVARRLRALGADPPLTDFIAWVWMSRPAAAWPAEAVTDRSEIT